VPAHERHSAEESQNNEHQPDAVPWFLSALHG
jgi:hypothetical protein